MSKRKKILLTVIVVAVLTIGTSLTTIVKNSVKPERIAYELPKSSITNKNWQTIFQNTSAIDQFKVLNTGSVKVPLDGMLNTKKLEKDHNLSDEMWVDVFVFMFHHKEKGWFMIDSGLDKTFQKDGNIKGLLAKNFIIESKQQEGQNIASQLKKENKDVEGIFFTHLHGDHTAGLPELDSSLPKYVGKGDEYLDIPILYHSNHLTNESQIIEMDWSKGIRKEPFKQVIDIFGDGSFLGIHTPGHSNGHLSYLLMTEAGPKLLTGDASHTKYGFENNIEPGWIDDQKVAENSLSQLINFHRMFPSVEVIYGHQQ